MAPLSAQDVVLLSSAVRSLLSDVPSGAVICVVVRSDRHFQAADRAILERAREDHASVTTRPCPPTYDSGGIPLVSRGERPIRPAARPAGYADPFILELFRPAAHGDSAHIQAKVTQGASFRSYACVTLLRVMPPEVRCTIELVGVH